MKKLIASGLFILGFLIVPSSKAVAGCTVCTTSSDECHRIIMGNEVHIFHGIASECEEFEALD